MIKNKKDGEHSLRIAVGITVLGIIASGRRCGAIELRQRFER